MATQSDDVSPSWCRRLVSELHAADERARALAKPMSEQQLNWNPGPGGWSVGQCLEHLCITNEVYLPAIADSLAGRPPGAADEISPGWLGRWFIRNYIEPSSQTRRARAPKAITPGHRVDASILDRFLSGNQTARDLVRRAGGYDVNRIRFRNPFIPVLRFTVGTGLEIVAKHQRRHLLQAERISASGEFPRR